MKDEDTVMKGVIGIINFTKKGKTSNHEELK